MDWWTEVWFEAICIGSWRDRKYKVGYMRPVHEWEVWQESNRWFIFHATIFSSSCWLLFVIIQLHSLHIHIDSAAYFYVLIYLIPSAKAYQQTYKRIILEPSSQTLPKVNEISGSSHVTKKSVAVALFSTHESQDENTDIEGKGINI